MKLFQVFSESTSSQLMFHGQWQSLWYISIVPDKRAEIYFVTEATPDLGLSSLNYKRGGGKILSNQQLIDSPVLLVYIAFMKTTAAAKTLPCLFRRLLPQRAPVKRSVVESLYHTPVFCGKEE